MAQKSSGKTGIGVILERADTSATPVFAAVANVTTLSAAGVTVNMVDATHLNSPDFYSEFVPSLKSAAEWTMTLQWDPSDATVSGPSGIRKQLEDRTIRAFRINTLAAGWAVMIQADCYIAELGNIEITPEGLMTQSMTLRPSGKPLFFTPAPPLLPAPAGRVYVTAVVNGDPVYEINQSGAYVTAPA